MSWHGFFWDKWNFEGEYPPPGQTEIMIKCLIESLENFIKKSLAYNGIDIAEAGALKPQW